MNKDIRPDKTSPAYLKNKNSGGLFKGFLYVLLFMSILSLAIWQNYSSSSTSSKIQSTEDRLAIIEEQMNIADEVNNDSLTDISSSIQFLDKEINPIRRVEMLTKELKRLTDLSVSELQDIIEGLTHRMQSNRTNLLHYINDLDIKKCKGFKNYFDGLASNK